MDEAIATAWDVSAGRAGRGRYQAVVKGSEVVREGQAKAPRPSQRNGAGEAQLRQWARFTPPAG